MLTEQVVRLQWATLGEQFSCVGSSAQQLQPPSVHPETACWYPSDTAYTPVIQTSDIWDTKFELHTLWMYKIELSGVKLKKKKNENNTTCHEHVLKQETLMEVMSDILIGRLVYIGLKTYIFGLHDSEERKEYCWQESSDSQWQHFGTPVHCH